MGGVVGLHYYRGYRVTALKGGNNGYNAYYLLEAGNFHLPRKFHWSQPNSMPVLERYIDALVEGDAVFTKQYEDEEIASGHVYEEYQGKSPLVKISPQRMASILLGEDPLELPANAMMTLRTDKYQKKFVPSNFMAALVDAGLDEDALRAIAQRRQEGRLVEARTPKKSPPDTEGQTKRGGRKIACPIRSDSPYASTASNLLWAELEDGQKPDPAEEKHVQGNFGPQGAEVSVSIEAISDKKVRAVSMVTGDEPYYVRRTMTSPEGTLLRMETAWDTDGPWHVCWPKSAAHADDEEVA